VKAYPIPVIVPPAIRIKLPRGKDYGLSLPTSNPSDTNSITILNFQVKKRVQQK